jgi:hypothetical protein
MVIVFPELRDIASSTKLTSRVVDFLVQNQITVVDLAEELRGRQVEDLIVHPFDGHPSIALNKEIANLLHKQIIDTKSEKFSIIMDSIRGFNYN